MQETKVNLKVYLCGIKTKRYSAINTQAELETLWRSAFPGVQIPEIDFTKQTVLAAFLGEKPSGGYEVTITGVKTEADKAVVSVTEKQPPAGAAAAAVMTQPFHIITVDKITTPVIFQ